MGNPKAERHGERGDQALSAPSISLPKGGGAIRGIGEKFTANPVTGTGSVSLPIACSPGRSGFGPQLALAYDSGAGNGPFGFGWTLSLPAITRKTEKGLPQYRDAEESDTFLLSGAEDLVPMLQANETLYEDDTSVVGYTIRRYRPRIEGSFARIERWFRQSDGDMHWRSISPDNILTIYGADGHSRIADPSDPTRVFSWLISESRDDRGNAVIFEYKPEDGAGVDLSQAHERNRGARDDPGRTANRYPKRIRYGNQVPLLDEQGLRPRLLTAAQVEDAGWHFELVFDYGEHDLEAPTPNDAGEWAYRSDPFSDYRAGFEVRTTRLCRRALMFHHFAAEPNVGNDCLVRSTDLTYSHEQDPADARNPIYTFLTAVTESGYRRQGEGYEKQSLPPVTFAYSQPVVQETVQTVDPESLENLPVGLEDQTYTWTDLHGESVPGILSRQGDTWYYKRNISPLSPSTAAAFAPLERLATQPADRLGQFMDLAGDGLPDLVRLEGPLPGLYEHDRDEGWEPFRPFTSRPNRDMGDPNLRLIDLDGDGRTDLLITEEGAFTWHRSLAGAGFGPANRVPMPLDEERGPRLLFAESLQSIHLADLNGDGLTDLVRIRNGEVCYWPNLGYGRFGAKITMDGAPRFDHPDQFDPGRIRLADIDGSGTTDIIYLHRDGVRLYFNQSGNSWSQPQTLAAFPRLDNLVTVAALDLLGNATACLVWSSPLPGDAGLQMRYVDLMGGQKPHLLTKITNNMGAESRVQYASSAKFYLADRRAGTPWATRLPFPVQVVEQVESRDQVAGTRFVSRYTYHHGYYDGEEREFRGFGMVEQVDSEAYEDYVVGVTAVDGLQEQAPELFQPPVTTRTWYHTGAFIDRERILHQFRQEYYQATQPLPEPTLPTDLDTQELRECLRALKGLPLRQEVYSFDGSAQEAHPYSVVEYGYEIRRLQPRSLQRHAVFLTLGSESVSFTYDRNPADPHITHSLTLEADGYGNPLASALVVYGRKLTDPSLPTAVTEDQQRCHITYGETKYTQAIDQASPTAAYRMPVAYESLRYEITGLTLPTDLFEQADLKTQIAGAAPIEYEIVADGATPEKRLLSHHITLFLDNDLNPLPLGQWERLGLIYQGYQLAFTPGVVTAHYTGEVTDTDFTAAGYVHFDGDENWWIPSATALYPSNPADHFFLPVGARDPMGVETVATRDPYDLLTERVEVIQSPWLVTTAVNDYRVLGPTTATDPNGNRTMVELDTLGVVVKTAIMGKAGSTDGDTLDDPTVRIEYDLFNWVNNGKPNYLHTYAREEHGPANPRWQESYTYLNGGGGIAMVKAQAHPGKAFTVNADGTVTEVDSDPRWVGNGRTILNNKGNPVKRYEPYFSTTHEYEGEEALRSLGVTPILYYDAVGRNHLTRLPDGTLTRLEFGPWWLKAYDANDTVQESQWYSDRGSPDPTAEPEPLGNPERRAAWLAAKHAGTPGVTHLDSLGRAVYAISDYGGGITAGVRSASDLTGRLRTLYDQAGREVSSGFTGMVGTPIVGESAEKGRRWSFPNVLGTLVKSWDEHGRRFRMEYDELHRPVASYVQEAGGAELLFTYVAYGDLLPNARDLNLLGVAHQIFDQAGMVQVPEADFKGNPKRVERTLANAYTGSIDWSALVGQPDHAAILAAATPLLETGESFTASASYDALNRPTQVTLPDQTVILPAYNEANLLASLHAQIRGQGSPIEFLKEQEYDARGQRQYAHYGNELLTRYFYDPNSFRLINLLTHRSTDDPAIEALQDLHYTYDPVGNITQITDNAQQTHYFQNAVVKPESRFEYDAIYQLVRAAGREHASLTNSAIRTHADLDYLPQLPHVNDAAAVRTYTETYEYDLLGNLKVLRHQAGAGGSWTRHYRYAYQSDPTDRTNRLIATRMPGDPEAGPYTGTYDHDPYGNMTRMPHLASMGWNFMDQLQQVDLGGGGTAYYQYGVGGQRIRKVVERSGNLKLEWLFLGAVMLHRRRRRDTNELRLERWTVHIADNVGEIAQVDTKTLDLDGSDPANPLDTPLIRYQYANHLGSAVLETNEHGEVISYEEYHPFGTTAYRSAKPGFDLSLKRFRFSGKERDDETGLYYFGARYYAPWLGRWTSSDPAGFAAGINLFRYCANNPVLFHDPNGTQEKTVTTYPLNEETFGKLAEETDPAKFSAGLRAMGFDFTGYDKEGKELAAGPDGKGRGLAKATKTGWDVGTFLKRPDEGENAGGGPGGGAPPAEAPPAEAPPAEEPSSDPPASGPTLPPAPVLNPNPTPTPPTPLNPIPKLDITQAPPGTDFEREESQARAAYRQRHGLSGRQVAVQHPQKWRDGARTNTHPRITNHPDFLHPISNQRGTGGTVNGRQYATQHTYADRGLYPQEAARMQRQYGGVATERVTTLWAGQSVRQTITGSRGPTFWREYIIAPMLRGAGGHAAIAATRTFVPFVAEAELGLMGAGMMLSNAGYTAAGATVFGLATYVPVAGGGLAAGAIVGNAAESLASELGASKGVAQGAGALAAVGAGAGVGALIGSVIPGVGTAVGGAIGAVAGLVGYGLSKLF